jgi:NUMOD3 motif
MGPQLTLALPTACKAIERKRAIRSIVTLPRGSGQNMSLASMCVITSCARNNIVTSMQKRQFSEEHRAKLAAACKKRWAEDLEYREKMQAARKPVTAEHRSKLSAAHKHKWRNPEHKKKMLAAHAHRRNQPGPNEGVRASAATRQQMSQAHLGRKHSPATLASMSSAQRGKKRSLVR